LDRPQYDDDDPWEMGEERSKSEKLATAKIGKDESGQEKVRGFQGK